MTREEEEKAIEQAVNNIVQDAAHTSLAKILDEVIKNHLIGALKDATTGRLKLGFNRKYHILH